MWLIGNLLDVLRMSFPKAAQHWRKQYGPVFKVTLGCSLRAMLIMSRPGTPHQVMYVFIAANQIGMLPLVPRLTLSASI